MSENGGDNRMKKTYIEPGENYNISRDAQVKKTKFAATGDIEIKHILINNKNSFAGIRKINKYTYVELDTGEIKEYKLNAYKSIKGLRKSMSNLKYILKNNFSGAENELFMTLTSSNGISTIKEIKSKFQVFWRKLKNKYKDLEFVAVFEQNSEHTSWHMHLILKAVHHEKLTIPNKEVEALWGDYTKVSRITRNIKPYDINEKGKIICRNCFTETFGINRVISYLCKTESKECIPSWERSYETSRGIKKPEHQNTVYKISCEEMENNYDLKTEYTSLIRDTQTNKIINKIKTETWKNKNKDTPELDK